MGIQKFNQEEIEFIQSHYALRGSKFCADELGRSTRSIQTQAGKLKIKRIHGYQNWNYEAFESLEDWRVIYFLGFMWADGNISKYKSGGNLHHHVSLEIKTSDMETISPTLDFIGSWSKRTRKRGSNWSETSVYRINSQPFFETLKSLQFLNKSLVSPSVLLEAIPKGKHYMFWRGFFDGDGHISWGKNYNSLGFNGSISQDWSDLIKLIEELGITYGLYEKRNKINNHKGSVIVTQSKVGISRLIDYLYQSNDEIGLTRKKIKCYEFKRSLI